MKPVEDYAPPVVIWLCMAMIAIPAAWALVTFFLHR